MFKGTKIKELEKYYFSTTVIEITLVMQIERKKLGSLGILKLLTMTFIYAHIRSDHHISQRS